MHELSIAMSVIELAESESRRHRWSRVLAVHLRLGKLAGVVKEALLWCYEAACQDTVLQGSELIIEEVPAVIHCPNCDADNEVESSEWFLCPVCGSTASELVRGKELEMTSLEVE
jgi:hydrogenase nickel incorporation protein HypA/HybF